MKPDDGHALFADGLEEALVGIGTHFAMKRDQEVAVYDWHKCISVLMHNNQWTADEAYEWMDFNVTGASYGAATPVFILWASLDDYKDYLREIGELDEKSTD